MLVFPMSTAIMFIVLTFNLRALITLEALSLFTLLIAGSQWGGAFCVFAASCIFLY
jgi:hypothetical protein